MKDPALDTLLREVRERCEAASPAPWSYQMREDNGRTIYGWIRGPKGQWVADIPGPPDSPNGRFIAHARTDIPLLLEAITRLREQCVVAEGKERALRELCEGAAERVAQRANCVKRKRL